MVQKKGRDKREERERKEEGPIGGIRAVYSDKHKISFDLLVFI